MRGYATLIAGLVMFVLIATSAAVLFGSSIQQSARISEAKHFRDYVTSEANKFSVRLVSQDWNGDSGIFTAVFENTGSPFELNSFRLFLDGKYVGSCADLNCSGGAASGIVPTGATFSISLYYPALPYRISATASTYALALVSTDLNNWYSDCRGRIQFTVSNTSASSYVSASVPLDLNGGFDYTSFGAGSIAVTDESGVNVIPFWPEYWNAGGNSRIWVRLDLNADSNRVVYLYYGCSSPPSYTASDVFLHDVNTLVAYWPMDEGSGSVAHDAGGNGHDLNVYGAIWVSGYRNGAVYLDGGTDSYLILSGFADFPSTAITAIFWMETNDTSNSGVPISYASTQSPDDFAVMNYAKLRIYVAGDYRWPGDSFNDGSWHMLGVSWRSVDGNVVLYDNATQIYTNTLSDGNAIAPNGCLVLGQDQDSLCGGFSSTQSFIGVLDEVMLFSSFLSASTISDIYSEDYFTSPYHPGHLFVLRKTVGVSVSRGVEQVYSTGG